MKLYQLFNAHYSDGRAVFQRPLEWIYKNQNGAGVTVSPCVSAYRLGDFYAVDFSGRSLGCTLATFDSLREAQNFAERVRAMTCEEFGDYLNRKEADEQ